MIVLGFILLVLFNLSFTQDVSTCSCKNDCGENYYCCCGKCQTQTCTQACTSEYLPGKECGKKCCTFNQNCSVPEYECVNASQANQCNTCLQDCPGSQFCCGCAVVGYCQKEACPERCLIDPCTTNTNYGSTYSSNMPDRNVEHAESFPSLTEYGQYGNNAHPSYGNQYANNPAYGNQYANNPAYGNQYANNPAYGNQNNLMNYANPMPYGNQNNLMNYANNPAYGNQYAGSANNPTMYGNPSYGNPSYGNPSYGNPSYGNPSYGNQYGINSMPYGNQNNLMNYGSQYGMGIQSTPFRNVGFQGVAQIGRDMAPSLNIGTPRFGNGMPVSIGFPQLKKRYEL